MKINICANDFNTLEQHEIDFINSISHKKIGYYLEYIKNIGNFKFPLYHISELCGDKGINLCLDIESAFICSRISSNKRYLLINNLARFQNIKYDKLNELIKKEHIVTTNKDIIYLTEKIFNNKGYEIDSQINIR